MPNQTTGAENIRWDLGSLYSGVDDPQIDADMIKYEELAKNFRDSFKGKLAKKLPEAIEKYSEIYCLTGRLQLFLYLSQSTDVTDSAVKAKLAEFDLRESRISGEYLTFFTIELVALKDTILDNFYKKSDIVRKHRSWIEHRRIFKPHLLTEPVEGALTKRAPFGNNAWGEFFDELEADLRFDFQGEQKTLTEILNIMTESQDADERFICMQAINKGFEGHFVKYSAQTLYMVAGSLATEVAERGYKHPMEPQNKSNRIPEEVVDALHRAVLSAAGPYAQRYYRLKAAHLGLPVLRWSDRNAPMPFEDMTLTNWNDAVEIVLAAYKKFSPKMAELFQAFIDEKRIDAPATKGKRGGAFNYSMNLPGNVTTSYVFLNYLGSNRDVMTIAHEGGHGVHGMLAGEAQGALMMHAPTAYAETASVFGEMTTFNFLREKLEASGDTKALLALTMSKIDDMLNTVVRQIGFSNFERRLHGMDPTYSMWSEVKKLSFEELDKIWLETLAELYGEEGDVFTYEKAEHLWAYISHFHRPFYVYGYAFGELLTQSLYAQWPRLGDKFEPLYLDMLRAGSTKDVIELLKPFGLDPTDEKFWQEGIEISIGAMVKEAERLSKELGVSI